MAKEGNSHFLKEEKEEKKQKDGAQPGFEPGTSCTQSRNHTPRPLSLYDAEGQPWQNYRPKGLLISLTVAISNEKKRKNKMKWKKVPGSGGIRTHAPEETGALNQRLRPLGHATLLGLDQTVLQVVFSLSHVSLPARLFFSLFSFFCAPLLL